MDILNLEIPLESCAQSIAACGTDTMLIFLTGYRGTGKSTVGAILAGKLGYAFFDSDDMVEQRTGKSIADIFAMQGEEQFRNLETDVISELVRQANSVVALGGGAVLREQNRRLIGDAGTVVWLRATVDTIQQRLALDPHTAIRRPNLTARDVLEEIADVLNRRTRIYEACANVLIDVDQALPGEVAAEILRQLPASSG